MKSREVKKWLRATPTCRHGVRYVQHVDEIASFYVPQLGGRDAALKGDPITEFANEQAAVDAARRFQDAIRHNHPEVSI